MVAMNNFNIDQIIDYVKIIVDNILCPLCDRSNGQQMRFSCGHTACKDCVIDAKDCQICLFPPRPCNTRPIPDDAFTQRVKNASVLLKACQDLFNIDVFQRKRLSDQLKIEKELFPKCIQAPVKYENKRKSNNFFGNKENRQSSIYPGEETSMNGRMENTVNYVQQWLNKNEKDFSRKPFSDLNVNTNIDNNFKQEKNKIKVLSIKGENIPVLKTNRKRSHFKTIVKNFSPVDRNEKKNKCNSLTNDVKNELYQAFMDDICKETKKVCDNDESGIFMDNDTIVIDDSQDIVIDKDKNAWLAVLEANKNEEAEKTLVHLDCSDAKNLNYTKQQTPTMSGHLQIKGKQDTKVPFFKKSYIIETCKFCNKVENYATGQSENVKITIDNDNFTTTINILSNVMDSSDLFKTHSVSVQTDMISETVATNHYYGLKDYCEDNGFSEKHGGIGKTLQKSDTQSEDLFTTEGIPTESKCNKNTNCKYLVIEETDSDMDIEDSGPLPVKVDVHRSCDESEYGVLGEIANNQEHGTRKRRGPRGFTPTSTDSSEKENFNPNRVKKHIPKKKKYTKK